MRTWITPSIEALDVRMTKSGECWEIAEGTTSTNKIGETKTGGAGNSDFVEAITSPSPSPTFDVIINES